ncbi:hypothetical protein E5288_WYG015130 [Bos mutus]|uniref:Uncharacterized protein n=1 Tax=Bos mutus TaxID=72004 RepID=A0A6B0S4G4_9CETA|nr:hypothetical protein [Bos mutus]
MQDAEIAELMDKLDQNKDQGVVTGTAGNQEGTQGLRSQAARLWLHPTPPGKSHGACDGAKVQDELAWVQCAQDPLRIWCEDGSEVTYFTPLDSTSHGHHPQTPENWMADNEDSENESKNMQMSKHSLLMSLRKVFEDVSGDDKEKDRKEQV